MLFYFWIGLDVVRSTGNLSNIIKPHKVHYMFPVSHCVNRFINTIILMFTVMFDMTSPTMYFV